MKMEKSEFDDAKFEAMLDQLRAENPEILCASGNKIIRVCFSPSCKNALQCDQPLCPHCGINVHQTCPSFPLIAFTQVLNNRVGSYKDMVSKVVDIDNQLVLAIEKSKRELISGYHMKTFSPQIQTLVNELYKKKSLKSISGQEGKVLFQNMQSINSFSKDQISNLLQSYRGEVHRIIREMSDLKKNLLEIDQQLKINSTILKFSDEKSRSHLQFLMESLDNPKKMELLYRGSENEFSAAAFHAKCGDVENTLTLIRTQFGKTLAGFTPYKWHSVTEGNYVNNPAGGSFILSFDLREKLIPIETTSLILNISSWGPLFGGGNDMFVSDQCNINDNSGAGYISSYNLADKSLINNQQTYTAMSGATSGYGFKITEYQVFKVIR